MGYDCARARNSRVQLRGSAKNVEIKALVFRAVFGLTWGRNVAVRAQSHDKAELGQARTCTMY